jgi:hypothetical protein
MLIKSLANSATRIEDVNNLDIEFDPRDGFAVVDETLLTSPRHGKSTMMHGMGYLRLGDDDFLNVYYGRHGLGVPAVAHGIEVMLSKEELPRPGGVRYCNSVDGHWVYHLMGDLPSERVLLFPHGVLRNQEGRKNWIFVSPTPSPCGPFFDGFLRFLLLMFGGGVQINPSPILIKRLSGDDNYELLESLFESSHAPYLSETDTLEITSRRRGKAKTIRADIRRFYCSPQLLNPSDLESFYGNFGSVKRYPLTNLTRR